MNPDDEAKKAADRAAGQRAFIDTYFPERDIKADLDKKIIKLAVESYIDDAEAEKKRLLKTIEVEKSKNRDIKDIAERLALELERLSPGHRLASDTLALLLENKMKGAPVQNARRKK